MNIELCHAGEGPIVDVVIDVSTIYTATPSVSNVPGFKPHVNVPHMVQRWDGSLLTWFNVGQTHGAGTFSLGTESFGGGETWMTPGAAHRGPRRTDQRLCTDAPAQRWQVGHGL